MKKKVLRSCLQLLHHTGVARLLCRRYQGMGLILVLHRVLAPTSRPRIAANARIEITPGFLAQLIEFFLDLKYEVVSLDRVYDLLLHDRQPARPFVCFTFDDGYVDAHDVIFPIFRKYNVPYAVYVITDFPDRKSILWWYMLEDLVLQHPRVEFCYQGREFVFATDTAAAREAAFAAIRDLIMSVPVEQLQDCIDAIFSPYTICPDQYADQQMSWDQVKRLARDPLVTIGAHTVHHYNLKQLGPDQLQWEIETSRQRLEEKLGIAVHHFAYPYGGRAEVGPREFAAASAAGFHTMTTVREGSIFPQHRNHLASLPRIEITGRYQDITLVDLRRCGLFSLLRNGLDPVVTG